MLNSESFINPYVAGRSLGGDRAFYGRDDILALVEQELKSRQRNAIVLFGQRRIGKTSILLQLLRGLPSDAFFPIYFDLMDRAHKPSAEVLFDLANTLAQEAGIPVPQADSIDEDGQFFRRDVLPRLYEVLGATVRPVLLLDEFDVLDRAPDAGSRKVAEQTFFPYLRCLMEQEQRLCFVFVVGRKADELSIDVKATFKSARYKRVSVLDEQSSIDLIKSAQRNKSLCFEEGAVSRILSIISRHPFFTQLVCQHLWDRAHSTNPDSPPTIRSCEVDAIVPRILEAGENVFEWIWDGLPPAEKVIFAAIAQSSDGRAPIADDEILGILQDHGIRILTRELELAPKILTEWEMLRREKDGFKFFIELLRIWVQDRKPLPKVKDELDRIEPLAHSLFQSGKGFYQQGELDSSLNLLRQALRVNPNHLKARLLSSQILLEQEKSEDAIGELEQAYRFDPEASRYSLVRGLLVHAERLERESREADTLAIFERVLEISPAEQAAIEGLRGIWRRRGERAFEEGRFEDAIAAFESARDQEKLEQVSRHQAKKRLEVMLLRAKDYEESENWSQAIQLYQEILDGRADCEQAREALVRAQTQQSLGRHYAEGIGALKQENWAHAVSTLAELVHSRPTYKDAARLLAGAVEKLQKQQRETLKRIAIASENAVFSKERVREEILRHEIGAGLFQIYMSPQERPASLLRNLISSKVFWLGLAGLFLFIWLAFGVYTARGSACAHCGPQTHGLFEPDDSPSSWAATTPFQTSIAFAGGAVNKRRWFAWGPDHE